MRQLVIVALALVVLTAGGAFWYLSQRQSGSGDLDAAGTALVARVAAERAKDETDTAACRDLLTELNDHPQARQHRALIRGRAWMELLLGRDRRAWNLIDPNLGVEAEPEDLLLGALVLERRFALTGDDAMAHRGATLAENHFEATNELGSLFLAWQLQVRREDRTRRDALARRLIAGFPESNEARLVKTLVQYPDLREEAEGARAELESLESSFERIPPELDLALALFEVQSPDTVDRSVERVERVLKRQQSSRVARTIAGVAAMAQKRWSDAHRWFTDLLRQFPSHGGSELWTQMLAYIDTQLAAKDK